MNTQIISRYLQLLRKNHNYTQEELAKRLQEAGFTVTQATVSRDIREMRLTKIATTKGKHVYSEPDYSKMDEVFILFGKETKGLPEDILQKYIGQTIRIPMRETLRSLNLSNSVAIVAFEILRQKNFENLEEISSYFK